MPSPETPWLIGVDLQAIFASDSAVWPVPEFDAAVEGVLRLLPAFGKHVVLTRFEAPGTPIGAWLAYYIRWNGALLPHDDPAYVLDERLPDTATVETRTTFGKWDDAMSKTVKGSREVVLAGVATDCCILSTALAAADAGVHVRVVTDACAGATTADHQRALEAMALYAPLIELTTVDEVLASLK